MDQLTKAMKKLRKMQKKLEKQAKKVHWLNGKYQMPVELKKIGENTNDLIKKVDQMPNRLMTRSFGLLALVTVVAVVATVAVRNMKKNYMNVDNERYDIAFGEKDAQKEKEFDLDQVSLEELEEALLRVENELDEVNAAIERRRQ